MYSCYKSDKESILYTHKKVVMHLLQFLINKRQNVIFLALWTIYQVMSEGKKETHEMR